MLHLASSIAPDYITKHGVSRFSKPISDKYSQKLNYFLILKCTVLLTKNKLR